jgi:superfamily II DNA/RNA helicase
MMLWSATWPKEVQSIASQFLNNSVQIVAGLPGTDGITGKPRANPNVCPNVCHPIHRETHIHTCMHVLALHIWHTFYSFSF